MAPPIQGGDTNSVGDLAIFGVLTVSDRASTGVYEDLSGPAILQFFNEAVKSPWKAEYVVIPDEQPLIEQTIVDMVQFLPLQHLPQQCCWRSLVMWPR
jgi:molybdopterin adenylyltransferase